MREDAFLRSARLVALERFLRLFPNRRPELRQLPTHTIQVGKDHGLGDPAVPQLLSEALLASPVDDGFRYVFYVLLLF
ncbi:hypothetical protein [Verrucomicrobium sp. 3C]|uniref:hypothetical protein n=1 Tax=Verrucomicrobium sp. 3C TaxID=1134055 RepID=UPI00037B3E60|nr:hypothetical protein [Verrucomicrobium sp. 3C]